MTILLTIFTFWLIYNAITTTIVKIATYINNTDYSCYIVTIMIFDLIVVIVWRFIIFYYIIYPLF